MGPRETNNFDVSRMAHESLFDLLKIEDGWVTLEHPSLKAFVMKKLIRGGIRPLVEAQMSLHCIGLLREFITTRVIVDYDKSERTHSSKVDRYRYPLRNWSQHAHNAEKYGGKLLRGLQKLWEHKQLRQVVIEFSGCIMPPLPTPSLPCLLAGLDLQHMLLNYLQEVDNQSDFGLLHKCAALNSAESTLASFAQRGTPAEDIKQRPRLGISSPSTREICTAEETCRLQILASISPAYES